MRLKLDENLGNRGAELLRSAGHEVATVVEQHMTSATDETLIEHCRAESRCLVTLDLDFANPLRFRPSGYAGIAVLRTRHRPAYSDLLAVVNTLVRALALDDIHGNLWIVEPGRVRQYQPDDPA